jgi:hypothetical protein
MIHGQNSIVELPKMEFKSEKFDMDNPEELKKYEDLRSAEGVEVEHIERVHRDFHYSDEGIDTKGKSYHLFVEYWKPVEEVAKESDQIPDPDAKGTELVEAKKG